MKNPEPVQEESEPEAPKEKKPDYEELKKQNIANYKAIYNNLEN